MVMVNAVHLNSVGDVRVNRKQLCEGVTTILKQESSGITEHVGIHLLVQRIRSSVDRSIKHEHANFHLKP